MDCNKEEAIRARGVAEKKMQTGDFVGARKIALKAQHLFPELENISQLLTVCDVHCAAQNKVNGSEMNWYGILQVERVADEATIRKQYRKLALLLHPDKNKFAGAEAAFKLIGDANRVLADQAKRSSYDVKIRVQVRRTEPKVPPHQANSKNYDVEQYGVPKNFPDVASSHFMGPNVHQQAREGFSNVQQTFWTCCPFCNIRFQYYRNLVNRILHCQSCSKSYIAYDLGAQGMAAGSNWNQNSFPFQKEIPREGVFKANLQFAHAEMPSGVGVQGSFSARTTGSKPVLNPGGIAEVGRGSKSKGGENDSVEGMKEGVGVPKFNAGRRRESGVSKDRSRKRGRKAVVESSESCETASGDDTEEDVVIQGGHGDPSAQNSALNGCHHPRRSSRLKRHVSYKENVSDDDDFVRPLKSSGGNGSCGVSEEEIKGGLFDGESSKINYSTGFAADVNNGGSIPPGENLPNRKSDAAECKLNEEDCMRPATEDDIYSEVDGNSEPDLEVYECPDPEFNDFEMHKADDCFALGQIWALYDTDGGMPRFYARVKKVYSPGFKLQINWLEPLSYEPDEIDWISAELPVACGKYKLKKSSVTVDRPMLSHQVHCEKVRGLCSYVIYPRKGETWALFKNWDMKWKSNPENQRKYKFEIVEVLSDFVKDAGILVAYLEKIKGFVSLFNQTTREGIVSFRIPPKELLRFSHRIPSFRMTGVERENVPKGSFELDPLALPADFDEFAHPADVKIESKGMDTKLNGLCSKSPEMKEKPWMGSENINIPDKTKELEEEKDVGGVASKLRRSLGNLNGNTSKDSLNSKYNGDFFNGEASKRVRFQKEPNEHTPKKGMDVQEKNDFERETSKLRRSPRDLSRNHKKQNKADASHCVIHEGTKINVDGTEDGRHCDPFQSEVRASSHRDDEKIGNPTPNSSTKKSNIPLSSSPGNKVFEVEYHNFNEEKSLENFRPGQIWALYSDRDGLPKNYAQIRKIESGAVFRLHVTLLESCLPQKNTILPVCCGEFKLKIGTKWETFSPAAFSHKLNARPAGKNKFEIIPRNGEIWALYKNWSSEWKLSDLENCKYDVVVVLEDNGHSTLVLTLTQLKGFKSVFKAPRWQRSSSCVMEIPRLEFSRFSHMIPAYPLKGEKYCRLIDCWELDPASIPGILQR